MEIKVIGAGCETCEALYANARQALEQTGLSASVERVENLVEIVKLGVTQLPALMVEGQIVISGEAPAAQDIAGYLRMVADSGKDKEIARVFKAFCDENRARILRLLGGGEQYACVLLDNLRISQPTLSHHMKILIDAGMVEGRKEGKWVRYSLSKPGAARALTLLKQLVGPAEEGNEQP